MSGRKTADYARDYYSSGRADYLAPGEVNRIGKMLDMVGTGKKVLDIGCYDGSIGEMLIKKSNEVYGMEINSEVSEVARKKGLKVTVQDIESQFQFEDNFFDAVIGGEIIEHILDTDFFIDEIMRILKPGGHLIISTPNVASFGRRIYLLLGKNPYFEASLGYPIDAHAGHIRFFTRELLLSFLQHKGLVIEECTSDIINFGISGSMNSTTLANIFPTLGRSIIVKARRP